VVSRQNADIADTMHLKKFFIHLDSSSFVGSQPSDHYFRSVLSVCLSVCAQFFSAVFDPILIKLGHMLYVWV